jgi:carboxypeptidase C (cathepsin A)
MNHLNKFFCSVLLATAISPSFAENPEKKAESTEKEPAKEKEAAADASAETSHKLVLKSGEVSYKATAGTLTLKKADGSPRAKVFHVAYRREGLDEAAQLARPVCFCFNGGPGSSAVWLHMGAFGPQRVVLDADGSGLASPKPPFKTTANEHSLLDVADLVFLDPVSTGYSRAEKPEDAKQFHGFSEDVESVGDFIRLYVSKNKLWDSPKFLMGESYGAIRGAGLSEHLQSRYGMYLNGLIIVSGVLDFQTLQSRGTNDLSRICFLPSMAATAHFHKKLSPERQANFSQLLADAEKFSQTTYSTALLRGNALTEAERKAVAAELSGLIGLPQDVLLRQNLRIDPGFFFSKLLETEEKQIGRFDSRVVGSPNQDDPSYDVVYGAYAGALNSYVREQLNFAEERPYEILNRAVNPWNYSQFTGTYVSVADDLASAMNANPSLGVYIACGYRDLATPYMAIRHTTDHLSIPAKLRENIQYGYYEAGHMMYTNAPDLAKLAGEVRGFIQARQ